MDTAKLIELNKRYWQDMYDMCEGTDVKPWECVKFKITSLVNQQEIDDIRGFLEAAEGFGVVVSADSFIVFASDVLAFDTTPKNGEWIFAAGIVEGKPAFPGDRLYHKGTRTAFTVGERLVKPDDCSWKKPRKSKLVAIEKVRARRKGNAVYIAGVPIFDSDVEQGNKEKPKKLKKETPRTYDAFTYALGGVGKTAEIEKGDNILEYETGGVMYYEQLSFCAGPSNLILELRVDNNNNSELLRRIARGDKVIIKTVKR